jgi:O-glycosyl hydrolase
MSGLAIATAASLALVALGSAQPAAANVPGAQVSIWMSDPSTNTWLAQQAPATFTAASGDTGSSIVVDPTRTYQTMSGFGASITDTTAYSLNSLSAGKRNQLMQELFSPTAGIGMSYLRQPLGVLNTDLTRAGFSSLDDDPADEATTDLPHFSIASDQAEVIPLVKQARALNPSIGVLASTWSAPAWMKTNNSILGTGNGSAGSLELSNYDRYATYLVKAVQAYQAEGIPIDALTVQNEPGTAPSRYPGMLMSPAQQRNFIRDNLGPVLSAASPNTKILNLDHNWNLPQYPQTVLADPVASSYTSGTAFHQYVGSVDSQSAVKRAFPAKDIYFTEGSNNSGTTFKFMMQTQMIDVVRNWAKTVILWNIAAGANNQPSTCGACQPMVRVDAATDSYSYNLDYRAMAHVSKFVKPGAVRIASNSLGASSVDDVAFVNPDGSKVLVAYNAGSTSNTFTVRFGSDAFTYTLASNTAATFTWTGNAGSRTINPYNTLEAETASTLTSGLDTQPIGAGGSEYVGFSSPDQAASYANVDFQSGASSVTLRAANGNSTATSATIRLDSPTAAPVASIAIPPTGGWATYSEVSTALSGVTGVHTVYVVFGGSFNLDSLRFTGGVAAGSQQFLDDFEDGNSTGWTTSGGTWSVCQPSGGSKEFCKTDAGTGLALAGTQSWRNYTVESAVIPSDVNGTGVSVLGRASDANHFYQLELKRGSNGAKTWSLYKNNGNVWTALASGSYAYTGGSYYYLRLVMTGSSLSAYVATAYNGPWTYLGSAVDSTLTSGGVGVRADSTASHFDLVRVTAG